MIIMNYDWFQNVLVSPSEDQYELLLRRLRERVQDGGSETIFDIGIGEGLYITFTRFIFITFKCLYL